jgi:phosphatidylinositol alpha-1,6-mannosyltransferase
VGPDVSGRVRGGSPFLIAKPLRVLLLTWDFPPARGGIQIWMFELAKRLPDAEVTVFTTAATSSGDAGLRVVRLGSSRLGRLPWLAHLTIRTFMTCLVRPPDVIVCGHVVTVPAALMPAWILRVPFVAFAYAWEVRLKRARQMVGFLLRRAALVLAISRFTELAVLACGVPAERIRILHPGVTPKRFAREPRTAPPRLERMILTVSRLNELYKGHDMVIRALPLVRAKCAGARYVVAGDGRLRPYLAELAAAVGVEDIVHFAGEVTDNVVTELMDSCDLLVQMSRESPDGGAEGFGIVCLEAGAAGKPVVAGRSGGLSDAVVDGVTGLLVDPNDVAEIADGILTVLLDPDMAARFGQEGQARAQRFTWDHMARRARVIFGELRSA